MVGRRAIPPWRLTALLLTCALACIVAAALLWKTQNARGVAAVSDADFWKAVVQALLALATGLVISGVLAVVLKRRDENALRGRDLADLRWQLVEQLRGVHRSVKRSQLLIASHKSAKTYGEQIRESIMPAEVAVRDVTFMLRQQQAIVRADSYEQLQRDLSQVITYLARLRQEFTAGYEEVSATQQLAEEWNRQQVLSTVQALRRSAPAGEPRHGQFARARAAWLVLAGRYGDPRGEPTVDPGAAAAETEQVIVPAFPRLGDLLADLTPQGGPDLDEHRKEFSKPLVRAIGALLEAWHGS
jgi:membrane protein implicated in regulation of membrane protease activity